MSHPRIRTRKILVTLGITAFIGLGAAVAWAQAVPVDSAPASTVVPTFRPIATGHTTGTALPSAAAAVAAVPPGAPLLRAAAPYDPQANFPGNPAIMPSLPVTVTGPSLTEQDIRAYVATRSRLGARVAATGTTVKRVLCATNVEVRTQFGRSPDTANDRLICAVELAGSFTVNGSPDTKPVTLPLAFMFFDAKTGNLLEVNIPG